MNEQSPKRDWFYWFMAVFTATQLPLCALILLDFILHPLVPDYINQSTLFRWFSMLVIVPLVVFIAILVIRRAPGNVTGLFLLLWVMIIIGTTARRDTGVQLVGSLGIGWVGIWFLPLYFPDGRAYPRRFEPYIRVLCVALLLSVVVWDFSASQLSMGKSPNPLFITPLEGLFPVVSAVELGLLIVTMITILPSVIARFRGGDQRVRQQLKWLGWVFFGIILSVIPMGFMGITTRDPRTFNPPEHFVFSLWSAFITLAPFLAVSIAILRYRLYDIDIIIRKTLIYSLLTGILAVIYFGGVVLVQQIFHVAAGETPDVAIVLSTLAIAGLFSPLRRRIQNMIDRRLYRRKYNAEKTLEAFNRSLRDEVDLDTMKASLLRVVEETIQPAHVALWLRDPGQTPLKEEKL